ncbi:hypothetical protein PtA15_1A27 [Puccinia triticina]|uniref:Uncharacterized protein n=1 Tax=Puccinia triticina TaxID=208348 RepID=A0ABY7C6V9_9BASI|nr:uncharacterized protein PtA15_1A27 [Puccinia triticina]WAQ80689.1 hypothetical protein PtA15_1A27 [Puccinia triticina]WAR51580.1 hypothetical protein PtB15_1B16 [Puccinia triticina]
MDFTPKSFFAAFLKNPDMAAAVEHRYWSTPVGIPSTIRLVKTIRDNVQETYQGITAWKNFILNKASIIVQNETPPTGYFPKGGYYSSEHIKSDFFDSSAKDRRNQELVEEHMPFLFKLVTNKMRMDLTPSPTGPSDSLDEEDALLEKSDADKREPDLFGDGSDAPKDHQQRVITVSSLCAICLM